MIKKQIAFITAVVVLAFSGCGEDRSHPKTGVGVKSIQLQAPLASLGVSAPVRADGSRGYSLQDDGDNNASTLAYRWFDKDDTLVFDASGSKDMDTKGTTAIQDYTWIVKNENNATMTDACIDQNQTGTKMIIKICDEADDREDEVLSVTLFVKDNEGTTSSTKRTVTIY